MWILEGKRTPRIRVEPPEKERLSKDDSHRDYSLVGVRFVVGAFRVFIGTSAEQFVRWPVDLRNGGIFETRLLYSRPDVYVRDLDGFFVAAMLAALSTIQTFWMLSRRIVDDMSDLGETGRLESVQSRSRFQACLECEPKVRAVEQRGRVERVVGHGLPHCSVGAVGDRQRRKTGKTALSNTGMINAAKRRCGSGRSDRTSKPPSGTPAE